MTKKTIEMRWNDRFQELITQNDSNIKLYNESKVDGKRYYLASEVFNLRHFSIQHGLESEMFSIFLFYFPNEGKDQKDYIGYCSFCGEYSSIEEVFVIAKSWNEFLEEERMVEKFPNLIYFKDYECAHLNENKEEMWNKIKYEVLNHHSFSVKRVFFRKRYELLIAKAKKRKEIFDLYPYTSLTCLRMRRTKELGNDIGWIYPNYEEEKGYHVITKNGTRDFEDVDEALNFFCEAI